MELYELTNILRDGVWTVLKMGGPMLVLSMVVGVGVSIFQAMTSINEQTFSFIFKLSTIVIFCFLAGEWMWQTLVDYTLHIFQMIRYG